MNARDEPNRARRSREKTEAANNAERLRRRAVFLRELAEARALRARVAPRRSKVARLRRVVRMRSFRT